MILEDDRIEIWFIEMSPHPGAGREMESALCPREMRRAERFQFPADRNRFIMRRWTLRRLLRQYLGPTASIEILQDPRGKPHLPKKTGKPSLCFNYSFSGDLTVFAFSWNRDVGVDIERIRPLQEMLSISKNYFTKDEYRLLREQPEELRSSLFFTIWTRKEAVLKALGEGLLKPLDSFAVIGDEDRSGPPDVSLPGDPQAISLSLIDVPAPAGFACALAVDGPLGRVSIRRPHGSLSADARRRSH